MLSVPAKAPPWAQDFANRVEDRINTDPWPFLSRDPFTASQLTATLAAKYPYRLVFVSDGASNKFVAVSNGTAFYYLEGTAV